MSKSKSQGRLKKELGPDSTEPSLAIAPAKKTKESKRVTRELAEEAAAANPAPVAASGGDDASAAPAEGGAEAAAPSSVTGGEQKSKKKRKTAPETEEGASKPAEGKKAKKAEALKAGAKKAEVKKLETVAEPSVKIKKRKPTDPYTLEEIPVQAQRAIQYAQTLGSPDFKFNKGRQNWLMRNVYSASEVPEEFVEDALRYLRSVMGGSRDVMVKAARELLARDIPVPPAPAVDAEEKKVAPGAEVPKAEPVDDDDAEAEETEEQTQARLLKTGKERAERLLKSLGVPFS